jgi:GDPmannose 4,6-dehydratase
MPQHIALDDYINIQSKGLHNFLYAIRKHRLPARLFYAASSLIYGNYNNATFIDEQTPFDPICFYGITKVFGISLCRMYREKYGVFAVSGILFNHESEYRKPHFLTKKIVQTAVQIKLGLADKLVLGALDNIVDWSHAEDFICAFELMLKRNTPNDYIIASGQGNTIRDFVEIAFAALDLDWQKYVTVKQDFIQRSAVTRIGNSNKLKTELRWQPKYSFKDMILDLINKELKKVKNAPE